MDFNMIRLVRASATMRLYVQDTREEDLMILRSTFLIRISSPTLMDMVFRIKNNFDYLH